MLQIVRVKEHSTMSTQIPEPPIPEPPPTPKQNPNPIAKTKARYAATFQKSSEGLKTARLDIPIRFVP